MDLIYMPEVLSYGALRHPQYRDYEQPWNKDYFNYGKSTTKTNSQYRPAQPQKPASKTPCLLCKENKRRTLAAYIRGKARKTSCSEIHEEIEEIDEEEDQEGEGEGEEVHNQIEVKVKVDVQVEREREEKKTVKIDDEKLSRRNDIHDEKKSSKPQ